MTEPQVDPVVEARELLNSVNRGLRTGYALRLLRQLCDEVERLRPLRQRERKQLSTVIDIRGCDKCDLCEDHQ